MSDVVEKMARDERIKRGWPVPYLLDDPAEAQRLLREVLGYLHTCSLQHHGTDRQGRLFAMDALEAYAAILAAKG